MTDAEWKKVKAKISAVKAEMAEEIRTTWPERRHVGNFELLTRRAAEERAAKVDKPPVRKLPVLALACWVGAGLTTLGAVTIAAQAERGMISARRQLDDLTNTVKHNGAQLQRLQNDVHDVERILTRAEQRPQEETSPAQVQGGLVLPAGTYRIIATNDVTVNFGSSWVHTLASKLDNTFNLTRSTSVTFTGPRGTGIVVRSADAQVVNLTLGR